MDIKESEFGRGFTYCMGLFLAHEHKHFDSSIALEDAGLWFNAAADHLFELQIPDDASPKLKENISGFQKYCIERRVTPRVPLGDREFALRMAKDILMQWDKENNINVIKGDYE